ncbi:hypothetical protein JQ580_24920 [Bradyrhizobium japonicum]|uniref:hypothetical protein n=1 Tax=Bradyrhizobium japonicum TaxID=375 RepID=UPI001BAA5B80|nr:hypothetical protein [Bradyrhizobium japonicum]MBR0993968.1 hypothetical protein [Bradyrhizobium japonicum]
MPLIADDNYTALVRKLADRMTGAANECPFSSAKDRRTWVETDVQHLLCCRHLPGIKRRQRTKPSVHCLGSARLHQVGRRNIS